MERIRQIITERLENARIDYGNTTREPQLELKGQIEAYQDCLNLIPEDLGELSDGYHTFNSLYEQRCILFATIVNQNKDKAWKSYKHEDGQLCFDGGWFIVGIDTPEGSYTYHYENKYWNLFKCQELECGKKWDGHTDKDVARLLSITPAPRTEADIINDLKALGWNLQKQRLSYEYHFYKYGGYHIEIKGGDKVIAYEEGHEDWSCGEYEMHKPIFIPYDVYCLIYELLNLEDE